MVYSILNNLENNFPVGVVFNVKLYISLSVKTLIALLFQIGQTIEHKKMNLHYLETRRRRCGVSFIINGVFIGVKPLIFYEEKKVFFP